MTVTRKPPRGVHVDLSILQREVSQLFEHMADFDRLPPLEAEWVPAVDVYECDGRLQVVIEVPGVAPEALRVSVRDRQLTLSGQRREKRPAASVAGFLCIERPQGTFTRTVPVDVTVDVRLAKARLSQGLLTVSIPTVKDRRGRETVIPVQREEQP
jgi:HSP20 family protein